MNTLRIESTANVSTTIDEGTNQPTRRPRRLDPHRSALARSMARDRDALLAYLRQLDGNSLSAPTGK